MCSRFHWIRSVPNLFSYYSRLCSGKEQFDYKQRLTSDYAETWGTPEVWELIFNCLKTEPEDRPSMKDVEQQLQSLLRR
jgi:hypothetical protein